jgi:uncharacterized protein YcfL
MKKLALVIILSALVAGCAAGGHVRVGDRAAADMTSNVV